MQKIKNTIQKVVNKFIQHYMKCMTIYGDALLMGGSYGCV